MIKGIGVDIVRIDRMKKWVVRPLLLQRYFSDKEIEEAKKRRSAFAMSLAARFAAKEAFGKAIGTGLVGISLKDIAVENNVNGKPGIILFGKALKAFEEIGGNNIFVSLTHETDNAVAVVVIEE